MLDILNLLIMSYRYMRLVLFFDLPVETPKQRHNYRVLVRGIKRNGFYMLQKSVYIKLCLDSQAADSSIKQIYEFVPNEGSIFVLSVTEKQFASIKFILGEAITDVINNDSRLIEL